MAAMTASAMVSIWVCSMQIISRERKGKTMNREIRISEIMHESKCNYDAAENIFIEEIKKKYNTADTEYAESLYELEAEDNNKTENRINKLHDYFMDSVYESSSIVITHGEQTMEAVKHISNLLSELPLSVEDNNALVKMLTVLLQSAEQEQYINGFNCALKCVHDSNERFKKDMEQRRNKGEQ